MSGKPKITEKRAVLTSLVVSVSDVVLNLTVGLLTGSVVMFSQALQGVSDLVTAGILYYGVSRANKKPDKKHPFGNGREVFFFVLVAGLFMFAGTGLVSVFIGIDQIKNPGQINNVLLALAMLWFGLITNLYSFNTSRKRLHFNAFSMRDLRKIIRSSLVETKATFIIDALGSIAALFGMVALAFFALTGNASFDGLGSVVIGLSMMSASVLLMLDAKSLIVGRAVSPGVTKKIVSAAKNIKGVQDVLDLKTMYLGSGRLLVILEVHFDDEFSAAAIEKASDKIKTSVKKHVSTVSIVQVEAETPEEELTRNL